MFECNEGLQVKDYKGVMQQYKDGPVVMIETGIYKLKNKNLPSKSLDYNKYLE